MILRRQGYGGQVCLRQGYGVFAFVAGLALFGVTVPAHAQSSPELRAHHVTINAGVLWSGSFDVGIATAQLRGNGSGPSAPPFTLFKADSRVTSTFAPELKVGFTLTPRISLEGGASFSSPNIAVSITADAEAPSQELAGEKLQQYVFDGGVTWQLPVSTGRKLALFVSGGAGYLRQLHEERTLGETGQVYYTGAGARYWLRGGHGASKALGVRGDVRVNFRRKGIDFEDKMRTYPTFSLFLFVGL